MIKEDLIVPEDTEFYATELTLVVYHALNVAKKPISTQGAEEDTAIDVATNPNFFMLIKQVNSNKGETA